MPGLLPPTKTALLALAPYPGIALADVRLPRSHAALAEAMADLGAQTHIGFDTEARPIFSKGQESTGPDVVQFATATTAYVLQLQHPGCEALARSLLTLHSVVKVGFDLQQDLAQLRRRLGTEVAPLLDLTRAFHRMGYPRTLGIRSAVAVVFGQRFVKSKRVTTSNWSHQTLDPRQLLYAANDAYVALQVLLALQRQGTPLA